MTAKPNPHLVPLSISIRPMIFEDVARTYDLIRRCYPLRHPARGALELYTTGDNRYVGLCADLADYSKPYRNHSDPHRQTVAVLCGKIVSDCGRFGRRLEINSISVQAPQRRRGIATRLLRRACQRVVMSQVHATVSEYNTAAQVFLRSCGLACEIAETAASGDERIGDIYKFIAPNSDAIEHAIGRKCADKYEPFMPSEGTRRHEAESDAGCSGRR